MSCSAPGAAVHSRDRIRFDIFGVVVPIERRLVLELRDAAAARAGVSSRHRDLSLVLDRSLTTGSLSLRRPELRSLLALAKGNPDRFATIAQELESAARHERGDS
jgi:hypothetical protein